MLQIGFEPPGHPAALPDHAIVGDGGDEDESSHALPQPQSGASDGSMQNPLGRFERAKIPPLGSVVLFGKFRCNVHDDNSFEVLPTSERRMKLPSNILRTSNIGA